MNKVYEEIIQLAEGMEERMVTCRRDFHKYAESGWFEMRTSSLIARRLTELGYEVLVGEDVCKRDARMGVPSDEELKENYERAIAQGADPEFVEYMKDGMTGVIGILRAGEGPVIAMRFDIDALGVVERTDDGHFPAREGFASVNPGMMHACGHDGHATIGLGVAEVLMQIKDQLRGTVKLVFQPAEEGVRGAKSIVENGHMDDVQYMIGAHISKYDPGYEDVDVLPGYAGGLATTKYDVTFRGVSAHAGGNPEKGKNALLAAASAVLNLYAIPRHGKGGSRINVGTLHAGSGRNVVADTAKMEIEVRGETAEINQYMSKCALQVIEGAATMYGVESEVKVMGAADPLAATPALMERIARVCEENLGLNPNGLKIGIGGSEDVSYMVNRVQELGGEATFMRIMTTTDASAHNIGYNFGEDVLVKGVKVFCGITYDILGK